MLISFWQNLWQTLSIAAPWLIFGLLIAGVIKAKVSNKWVAKHLSGEGATPVIKGALIGAPLPLCSCSVIPVATQLHRSGASKGATAAFLVSTPETGVDSISLSYALLGPFMAVVRPVSAIVSAIITGLSIGWFAKHDATAQNIETDTKAPPASEASCCSHE
ncbi:MAG: permease, partial [Thiotrichales bacterium]|nr:permease [Thiotrichales bacterium]